MIIDIYEPPSGSSGGFDAKGQPTYKRTFRLTTAPPSGSNYVPPTGPRAVLEAVAGYTGLTIGSPYIGPEGGESDDRAYCLSFDANPVEDGFEWEVVLTFGARSEAELNPLDELPEITIDGREFERSIIKDSNDKEIKNSAKDFFDPPLVKEDSRVIIEIVRNEIELDLSLFADYSNTTNAETFLGFPSRTVKMLRPKAVRMWHALVGFYYRVTYRFEVKEDVYGEDDDREEIRGWDAYLLDAGYRELDDEDMPRVITTDGQPSPDPVPLDGGGKRLEDITNAKYLAFRIYRETDFAALNLEQA